MFEMSNVDCTRVSEVVNFCLHYYLALIMVNSKVTTKLYAVYLNFVLLHFKDRH